MYIPKYPKVPYLSDNQIKEITEAVFGEEENLNSSDIIFIFGSTHPATYQNALEAYNKGLGKEVIISGGSSGSKDKHKDWIYGEKTEARVIFEKLASQGVPVEKMFLEEKSKNSKENVLFAKEAYDFSKVKSLIFISKNYVAGRQYRTLKKHLSKDIKISSYTYNIYLDDGSTFDRYDWIEHEKSKSLVFGEYLRIAYYGQRGDIEGLNYIDEGLKKHIELILQI